MNVAISSGLADKAPSNYGGPSGQQPSYGQPTYGNGPSADEEVIHYFLIHLTLSVIKHVRDLELEDVDEQHPRDSGRRLPHF